MGIVDEGHRCVVRARLIVEHRQTVLIRLVGVDQVLRGEEEAIAVIGAVATRRVEQVAPVDTSGIARAIAHRVLHGEDSL